MKNYDGDGGANRDLDNFERERNGGYTDAEIEAMNKKARNIARNKQWVQRRTDDAALRARKEREAPAMYEALGRLIQTTDVDEIMLIRQEVSAILKRIDK